MNSPGGRPSGQPLTVGRFGLGFGLEFFALSSRLVLGVLAQLERLFLLFGEMLSGRMRNGGIHRVRR